MKNKFLIIMVVLLSGSVLSCNKQLNLTPTDAVTDGVALNSFAGYQQLAAKVYGSTVLSGNSGNGSSDLQGFDAGSSDFLRLYWNAQVLSTDEAICAWGDAELGTTPMHTFGWTSQTGDLNYLYNRCYYVIAVCNDFIRESSPANLSARGITGANATEIGYYQAEARFIRAYQYWVLMDAFGNPAFITDKDPVADPSFSPPQKNSSFIFNYIESELKAIDPLLKPAKTNDYGRVDKGAEWALLARMYLNAVTYTGTARYTDAITYSSKVIAAGYSLHPKYQEIFLADNNLTSTDEMIWTLNYDGTNTQIYGGTTFLINSSCNGTMNPGKLMGAVGGWGGNRSTSNLPALFTDPSGATDQRAMFTCTGCSTTPQNTALTTFIDGLPVIKFKNITSTGVGLPTTSADGTSCSTDFPVFRLAEQYLIYAEAVLRGGTGGNMTTALGYVNALRTRAYANATPITDLTVIEPLGPQVQYNIILNERARELYWECLRRTDLIRYGLYAGSAYVWPWKGGVASGTGLPANYNLFPLPASALATDLKLVQNPGYN